MPVAKVHAAAIVVSFLGIAAESTDAARSALTKFVLPWLSFVEFDVLPFVSFVLPSVLPSVLASVLASELASELAFVLEVVLAFAPWP